MTTVLVVRHGETTWNRGGRIQGWAPTRLTDRGRKQAEAAAALVDREYDVDRIHASDLLRARETVEQMRTRVDAPVTFDRAWRERDFGVYQGFPHEDVFSRFPEMSLDEDAERAIEAVPESGESLRQVEERVLGRWTGLLADQASADAASDETRLVVTHSGPIAVLLGHVRDVDMALAVFDHAPDNCALTEFVHDPERGETRVVRENVPGRE